jgi:putative transposase
MRRRFSKGTVVIWRGRRYLIERREGTGDLHLRDVATDERRFVPDETLIDALFSGELEILDPSGPEISRTQARVRVDDLALLPEQRRKEAKRRYRYVQRALDRRVPTATKASLAPVIEEVAKEIADPHPPSWLTLYRWLRTCRLFGEDIRVLVPSVSSGNKTRKFGTGKKGKRSSQDLDRAREVASIVDEVISESYLNKQRLSVQAVHDVLEGRIAEINRFRMLEDRLPLPHRDSLYDIIDKLDPYEKDVARHGRRYADQRWRVNKQGIVATRPLERVEIDHTKLDQFVVDTEYRLPIGRPWLTTAVDKYSRMPLGYYLSFTPPSALSVMQCLLHAIKPKTYLREKYPNVEHDWETYGIPESLASDNGLEFLGDDYEDACLQLGIAPDWCPARMPWFKAVIENYFAIQNRRLLHRLPGTTFSNIFQKGEYDPRKNALISFEALQEMVHIWLVDIYSQSEHRGLHGIPARVWKEGIAQFKPALPKRISELHILLGQVACRDITKNGIELFGMRYRTDELARLRREDGGKKVLVKYDANDLSLIYVADCRNLTYVPVPAEDQEYTKGLTFFQHQIIRRYCRENIKAQIDVESLRRAKAKLQAIIEREWALTKRSRTRVRMARYLNISSEDAVGAQSESTDSMLAVAPANGPATRLLPGEVSTDSDTDAIGGSEPGTNARLISPLAAAEQPREQGDGAKPRRKKASAKPHETVPEKTAEATDAQTTELDLTGWSIDFDLP